MEISCENTRVIFKTSYLLTIHIHKLGAELGNLSTREWQVRCRSTLPSIHLFQLTTLQLISPFRPTWKVSCEYISTSYLSTIHIHKLRFELRNLSTRKGKVQCRSTLPGFHLIQHNTAINQPYQTTWHLSCENTFVAYLIPSFQSHIPYFAKETPKL